MLFFFKNLIIYALPTNILYGVFVLCVLLLSDEESTNMKFLEKAEKLEGEDELEILD